VGGAEAALAALSNASPRRDLADAVGRIAPRPVLLIRALDGNPDERLNRVYYAAAHPPKAWWQLPHGGHIGALSAGAAE